MNPTPHPADAMRAHGKVGARFQQEADRFDAIYGEPPSPLVRWFDLAFRENVRWRFGYTLEALEPVASRRVLDAGCGPGRYAVTLAKRGAGLVVGLDLAPRMLELAQARARHEGVWDRCRFVRGDIASYRAEAPFDRALAIGVFDYLPDPAAVLRRLRSCLNGRLVASFPARLSGRVPFRWLWRKGQGCYVRFYSRSEILALAAGAGFTTTTLVRHGPIYMLTAETNPGGGP